MSVEPKPKNRAVSSPEPPESSSGRRAIGVFALFAIVRALGWILIAQAIAELITPFAALDGKTEVPSLAALLSPQITELAELPAGANIGVAVLLGLAGAGLRGLAGWGTEVVANRIALGEKEHYRYKILEHRLSGAPSERVGDESVLLTRGLDGLDDYYKQYWPALVSAVFVPIILGFWILLADWVSALILVLTLPLIPLFMILIGQHTEERVDEAAEGLARISQNLYELARGLPVLVGLHRAGVHRKALRRVSERYRTATMKTLRSAFMSALALELIATLSVAVVAVFIGVRLVYGQMDLFAGIVVLVLAAEVYLPFRDIGAAYHASEDGLEALKRIRDELAIPAGAALRATPENDTGTSVQIRGLSMGYRGSGLQLLKDAELSLDSGGLAVLGSASGTGKSTLLKLLAGVLGEDELEFSVDHASMPPQRQRLYLSQHPVFTERTVAEEMTLYTQDVGSGTAQVEDALRLCSAAHLQERTLAELSPGEQRRVALARVLARAQGLAKQGSAIILYLDEPTAHLDAYSAERIRRGIVRFLQQCPTSTVLAASHDRLLHARASQVLLITETGSLVPALAPTSGDDRQPVELFEPPVMPPAPTVQQQVPTHKVSLVRMLGHLPLRNPRFIGGVLLATLTVLAAAALAALSGWLIVQASYQPPVLYLLSVIVGVRFFGIGRAAFRYSERLVTHRAILDWATQLRLRLWDALATNIRFWPVLTRRGGSLSLLISDVDELRDAVPRVLVPIPAAILSWAASSILLWLILPELLPIALLTGLLGLFVSPTLIWWIERHTQRRLSQHRSWLVDETSQLLAGAEEITANGLSAKLLSRYAQEEAAQQKHLKRTAFSAGIGQGAAVLLTSAAAVLAVAQALLAGLEAPMVALVGFLLLALAEPFGQMVEATHEATVLTVQLQKLEPLLRAEQAVSLDEHLEFVRRDVPARVEVSGLETQNLQARYPESKEPVFSGLNFSAEPGQLTLVTGPSGSGKSTLLAVLLGFLPPAAGTYRIYTNGPKTEVPAQRLFQRIAWCPQEAYLFNSTLAGNLALARDRDETLGSAEMIQTLRKVGLGPWLERAPDGLQTKIGAGGAYLSGGQRQRLALARALLSDADVLLLDEPTAHLGEDEAEELIRDLQTLKEDTALVIVTHQLTFVDYADSHVRLAAASTTAP